jgi:hypothetical protein
MQWTAPPPELSAMYVVPFRPPRFGGAGQRTNDDDFCCGAWVRYWHVATVQEVAALVVIGAIVLQNSIGFLRLNVFLSFGEVSALCAESI